MYFAIVLDVGTGSLVKLWFLSWNVDFLPRFLKFLPAFCFVCGFVSGQLITRILVQECRRRKQCVESNLLTLRSTENRDVITGLGIRRFVLRQSILWHFGAYVRYRGTPFHSSWSSDVITGFLSTLTTKVSWVFVRQSTYQGSTCFSSLSRNFVRFK